MSPVLTWADVASLLVRVAHPWESVDGQVVRFVTLLQAAAPELADALHADASEAAR